MNEKCPIWGTPAEIIGGQQQITVNSPRAGGWYWISADALTAIRSWKPDQKKLLTTWLCEQRSKGIETPRIDADAVEFMKASKPLSVPQRVQRALLFLKGLNVGAYCRMGSEAYPDTLKAMAETESANPLEMRALYNMLKDSGYVEGKFSHTEEFLAYPTIEGWTQIESLSNPINNSSQAFVAMWFDPKMNEAYGVGIAPAVAATGHKALRIDNKEHNNKIDDEIIAEIRHSRFLIADFTCKPNEIRGGVYYEAGFAMGIGIPVIWTCRKGSEDDLHFDTRQYAHIMWETPQDLFEKLKNRIGAVIGDGPLPKT